MASCVRRIGQFLAGRVLTTATSVIFTSIFMAVMGLHAREARTQDLSRSLGRELGRISLGGDAQSIAWSPDQRRIVVVVESFLSERRRITAIDAMRGSIDWSIDGYDTMNGKAAFLPGGASIVTRSLAPTNLEGLNWSLSLSILDAAIAGTSSMFLWTYRREKSPTGRGILRCRRTDRA